MRRPLSSEAVYISGEICENREEGYLRKYLPTTGSEVKGKSIRTVKVRKTTMPIELKAMRRRSLVMKSREIVIAA